MTRAGTFGSPVPRRTMIASGVGLSTLALPTAAVAASVAPSGGSTSTTVPATESLLFHLDADSYLPGLGVGWNDLSGQGNHGTIGSGATYVAAAGAAPAHFSFNGNVADSVVSITGGNVITGPTPTAYTKMIWFRRDTVAVGRYDNLISSTSSSGQSQHFLYFGDPQRLTAGHGGEFLRILSDSQTGANVWLFGAVRFSTTSGFTLYVNTNVTSWTGTPSLITSSPYDGARDALNAGGLAFNIGRWQSGDDNGLIGDVATALAYDVDIGDAAVKSYFASTVDRFSPA